MSPADVIADRFELESLAGEGGMGSVYRARDRSSGATVALKVLRRPRAHVGRFVREAQVLSELRHPGIVRYVDHGATAEGQPYLAMEWLEGESLRVRLGRVGLTLDESVQVAKQAAEALTVAHARGIVHRDLKPENLYLVDGRPDRVKLLDFGVALIRAGAERMTRAGVPLGTLGYMAPEQARAEQDLDARADVFALGCVLFECLTGRPAFWADHALTVLAKIVLEEPPRPREVRPDVPPELDALVLRMLAKDPAQRPGDAAAVLDALAAFDEAPGRSSLRPSIVPASLGPALGESEQQLMSAIVAGARAEPDTVTLDARQIEQVAAEVSALAESHGARLEALAGGSLVLILSGHGTPTDRAARAARCALELADLAPGSAVALATGTGVVSGRLPMGEVIERAVGLLAQGSAGPRIDEVTESLLPPSFELGSDARGRYLAGERLATEPARLVLGRAVPCVGRERELVSLQALLDECVDEPVARAVVLTGPPGIGKSRIRHELCAALERRSPGVSLWHGQGDPMRAGTPLGLLSDAVRAGLGLADAPPDQRPARLALRLARLVPEAERQRVGEFVSELMGLEAPEAASVQLRAARQDALLMRDQLQRAFVDLLVAECARQPVLLVLEDLQWGDLPSVELLDAALRALPETPLMVLGIARPELHDVFPGLWSDRGVQEIRVRELTRRASVELVERMLPDADAADVARIVERAAGNAFFLEELIRAHAAGRRDAPGSVLAMVQARLEAMEPEARRALRAASVFGQVFWRGGVSALLGDTRSAPLDDWLQRLTEREVVVRRRESKFAGEVEYAFRHALVRDAAYAMLTQTDRVLGHRLAGEFLERGGETDALVVLEHFTQGGAPDRALPWWVKAAESALDASDFGSALALARRGAVHAVDDEPLGALGLVEAEALRWQGQLEDAERAASRAMQLLAPGSARFGQAAAERALIYQRLGRGEALRELAGELAALSTTSPSEPLAYATVRTAIGLRLTGEHELSDRLLAPIAKASPSPRCNAYLHLCRALDALHTGDLAGYLSEEEQTRRCFEETGDTRRALNESGSIGYALMELGAYQRAEQTLSEALDTAQRLGLDHVVAASLHNLGLVHAHLGRFDQARTAELRALETFRAQNDRRLEGAALTYLARIHVLAGDPDAAEDAATRAVDLVREVARPILPLALATLAAVRRAQGRAPEALAAASEGMRVLDAEGAVESGEALVRLEHARALAACHGPRAAEPPLADARRRLRERADKIADPELRRCFLEQVPENAETLRP